MKTSWIAIPGIVVQGHRVASGPSTAYPYGSLGKQKPHFQKLGLDLNPYFEGTLNISIAPRIFEMTHPEYTFENVEWTDLHPPETFSFSKCRVIFQEKDHEGWVYYPHPETKKTHFQNPPLVEVITHKIPDIKYGDGIQVQLNDKEITVR